jgi:hypothetical protein
METEFSAMPVTAPARRPLFSGVAYLEPAERTWREAPDAVRFARRIAVAGTVLWGCAGAYFLGEMVSPDRAAVAVAASHFLALVLTTFLAAVNLWLVAALKKGRPAAWIVQQVVAYLGLLLLPLGTAFYLLLLLRWNRFETRAWFIAR